MINILLQNEAVARERTQTNPLCQNNNTPKIKKYYLPPVIHFKGFVLDIYICVSSGFYRTSIFTHDGFFKYNSSFFSVGYISAVKLQVTIQ
jgi:hypothetical protein